MKRFICSMIGAFLIAVMCLSAGLAEERADSDALTVAIYPYVPDPQLFEDILARQWEEMEPNVELVFKDWDCYLYETPVGIDVLMYDALFGPQLVKDGVIQPIDTAMIRDPDGILPYAMDSAFHDEQCYGIPFLACSEFLFYYKDDDKAASANSLAELYAHIEAQMAAGEAQGLSTNYSSNAPYYYLDAWIDHSGEYTEYEEVPKFHPEVLGQLKQMKSVLVSPPPDEKSDMLGTFCWAWQFNQGVGRVHFGYSEDLSMMEDIIDQLEIRSIAFAGEENIPLYSIDIVAMTSQVTDPDKRALCGKLMNLVASEAFQRELCFGSEKVQYMLPARKALYSAAAQKYPMYARLEKLVMDERNRAYAFGPDIFAYLDEAYAVFE